MLIQYSTEHYKETHDFIKRKKEKKKKAGRITTSNAISTYLRVNCQPVAKYPDVLPSLGPGEMMSTRIVLRPRDLPHIYSFPPLY